MTKSCVLKGSQKVFFLHLNQAASCCRSYPMSLDTVDTVEQLDQHWKHESNELDRGQALTSCQHCWQHENQGMESYRLQMANKWKDTHQIELFIDNTCNQMCSYCSPKFSSTWEKSINQHGMFRFISASAQENLKPSKLAVSSESWIEKIHSYIDCSDDNSITLSLLGGEPLMQIRNLQKLLTANPNKIRQLRINTNLNPPDAKFLHWVLETFPKQKLRFYISLDTVPEYNAIPRAGFDQNKFQLNLDLLRLHNVEFSFHSVISVLSIFSLHKFQQWLTHNNFQSQFFKINNPDCLEPGYLPQEFKQKVLEYALPREAKDSLESQPAMIDIKQFEQYNYLTQYFERTATNITDPNLAEYWHWLKEKFK